MKHNNTVKCSTVIGEIPSFTRVNFNATGEDNRQYLTFKFEPNNWLRREIMKIDLKHTEEITPIETGESPNDHIEIKLFIGRVDDSTVVHTPIDIVLCLPEPPPPFVPRRTYRNN